MSTTTRVLRVAAALSAIGIAILNDDRHDGSLSASDSTGRICLPAGTATSVADKSTITTTIKGTLQYG
jgi:hypothetical protein